MTSGLEQIERAAAALPPGTAVVLTVRHDPGCPTLRTRQGRDCACGTLDLELVPVRPSEPSE